MNEGADGDGLLLRVRENEKSGRGGLVESEILDWEKGGSAVSGWLVVGLGPRLAVCFGNALA